MYLLHTTDLTLQSFYAKIPKYAILSHTWGEKEVTFQDIQNRVKEKSDRRVSEDNSRDKSDMEVSGDESDSDMASEMDDEYDGGELKAGWVGEYLVNERAFALSLKDPRRSELRRLFICIV
ncbi:hypothetical protein K435DRAFT_862401 [Dendrothele bispora CBS 962.96]|uniref:Uncharacterized protein n=1 Tax=Dendrothele bispora (strain CBS 962.96) TaxID=1314807 RepID=A0A4S8LT34_DENBC|nr:hypothetical protein K435DRAFT_862401 [Dendrothele bispora CBS 962.96]